jgi:predicted alpha/beta hydrolase family esterase
MSNEPTILIVHRLRDQVAQHWQPLLEERVRAVGQSVVSIAPMGRDAPLARYDRVDEPAAAWGSRVADLGEVGRLNPASGYGEWPRAEASIGRLIEQRAAPAVSTNGMVL